MDISVVAGLRLQGVHLDLVCRAVVGVGSGQNVLGRLTWLEDGVPQANRLLLDRPVDHETVAVLHTHTLGLPVALTAVAFLIGLFMIPLAPETRSEVLRA